MSGAVSISIIMPATHDHVNHLSSSSWESATARLQANSQVKTLSATKACNFLGQVASLLFRTSIWESRRQNVHRTTARELDLHFKLLKKLTLLDHFWKMKSAKSVPQCTTL